MANVKKGKKRHHQVNERKIWVYVFAILILLILIWYEHYSAQQEQNESESSNYYVEVEDESAPTVSDKEQLHLHMISCGQADSFLFEQNGQYALIDCGTRSTGKDVVEYMQKIGVKELQFIVGTHPHDDHMGGMETVIENFNCKQIYMPKVENGLITANWYLSLMKHIKRKKIKVTNPKVNDNFNLGSARFLVVGQLSSKEAGQNINNYSTVIKVSFGEMDILMTGDAETTVEEKMLQSNVSLDCEILKVGHHGSTTSTSKEFLNAVSPEYAIISCGIGNKYEHPCKETMTKLKKGKIAVYRTDESGDVVITISPNDIKFNKSQGDYIDGPTLAKKKGVA